LSGKSRAKRAFNMSAEKGSAPGTRGQGIPPVISPLRPKLAAQVGVFGASCTSVFDPKETFDFANRSDGTASKEYALLPSFRGLVYN